MSILALGGGIPWLYSKGSYEQTTLLDNVVRGCVCVCVSIYIYRHAIMVFSVPMQQEGRKHGDFPRLANPSL